MKGFKRLFSIITIGVMVFSIVGCNNDTNIQDNSNDKVTDAGVDKEDNKDDDKLNVNLLLDSAFNNLRDAKSYTVSMNIAGTLESGGVEFGVNADTNADIIFEPLYLKKTTSVSESEISSLVTDLYAVSENNVVNVYKNTGDGWIQEEISSDGKDDFVNEENVADDILNIENIITEITLANEEASGDIVEVKAKIPADKAEDFLKGVDVLSYVGLDGSVYNAFKGIQDIDVRLLVDLKTVEIVEFYCDLSDAVQTVIDNTMSAFEESSEIEKLKANKYDLTIKLNNYNEVEKSDIPNQ